MKLLFDLDGTLTDPYEGITRCISYSLDILGRKIPPDTDLRWCIGPPLRDSFMKLLVTDDKALTERAVTLYRQRFGTVGLFENHVYDGIPEMLEALQRNGHTLYLATLKPTVYARRIIDHFGLQRYFTDTFGSELDGTRSDKTSLLSYILQTASIAPSAAAMIGDREHDIVGAKNNGVAGFGVLWGYGTIEELERSGAQAAFRNPPELARHFRNSSR